MQVIRALLVWGLDHVCNVVFKDNIKPTSTVMLQVQLYPYS